MKASEIMTTNVITVGPDVEVHALAAIFVENDISGAPVVDKSGKFLGIVLEESLIFREKKLHLPTFFFMLSGFLTFGEKEYENELKKISSSTVSGIMDDNAIILSPDTEVDEVATIMVEKNQHFFPVIENHKLLGVLTKKDIVRAIALKKLY